MIKKTEKNEIYSRMNPYPELCEIKEVVMKEETPNKNPRFQSSNYDKI